MLKDWALVLVTSLLVSASVPAVSGVAFDPYVIGRIIGMALAMVGITAVIVGVLALASRLVFQRPIRRFALTLWSVWALTLALSFVGQLSRGIGGARPSVVSGEGAPSVEALSKEASDCRRQLTYCKALPFTAEEHASKLLAVDPDSPDACQALRWGGQAAAAVFGAAMATTPEVMVTVGDAAPARVRTEGARKLHYPGLWIHGFFLAAISADNEVLALLSRVPSDLLRSCDRSNFFCETSNEYEFLFVDALQAFWRREAEAPQRLLAALEATDPDRLKSARDYTLDIAVPQMELLFRLMDQDAKGFDKALRRGLELHERYWSGRDPDQIAFGLTALASLAHGATDIRVEARSRYLPQRVVEGACAR